MFMHQFLGRKLTRQSALTREEIADLEALPIQLKELAADESVVLDGSRPTSCCAVSKGFLYRSKVTGDGGRQILSFHIPGDIPDLQSLFLPVMDYDLRALKGAIVGLIDHDAIKNLLDRRPRLVSALWRDTLIDSAAFRDWILNVGKRSAEQRVTHLIAELRARLANVNLLHDETFEFPATQADVADAVGLTSVHVNRVLKELRNAEVLEWARGDVKVLNVEKLHQIARFDPLYLHNTPNT